MILQVSCNSNLKFCLVLFSYIMGKPMSNAKRKKKYREILTDEKEQEVINGQLRNLTMD